MLPYSECHSVICVCYEWDEQILREGYVPRPASNLSFISVRRLYHLFPCTQPIIQFRVPISHSSTCTLYVLYFRAPCTRFVIYFIPVTHTVRFVTHFLKSGTLYIIYSCAPVLTIIHFGTRCTKNCYSILWTQGIRFRTFSWTFTSVQHTPNGSFISVQSIGHLLQSIQEKHFHFSDIPVHPQCITHF